MVHLSSSVVPASLPMLLSWLSASFVKALRSTHPLCQHHIHTLPFSRLSAKFNYGTVNIKSTQIQTSILVAVFRTKLSRPLSHIKPPTYIQFSSCKYYNYNYYYNHLRPFVPDYPGEPVLEGQIILDIAEAEMMG